MYSADRHERDIAEGQHARIACKGVEADDGDQVDQALSDARAVRPSARSSARPAMASTTATRQTSGNSRASVLAVARRRLDPQGGRGCLAHIRSFMPGAGISPAA